MSTESRRGFRGMDPVKLRQIASTGGKAAHARGTAHEFTPEEARRAAARTGRQVSTAGERMARTGSVPGCSPMDQAAEGAEDAPDTVKDPGTGFSPSS
jgi:hypothetical protein